MTTKILPQEFHFEDTSDSVRVKTVVDKELINEAMLLTQIRHFRLGAGTIIKVQVMTKGYDVLLHTADFVIERAVETLKRIVDERGERTAKITDYRVVQDSEWKSYSAAPLPVAEVPEREPESYVPGDGEIKWNPGRKAHEIIVAGKVFAEVTRRDGETKDEFKARALAIAAGSEPLPQAA